MAKKPTQTRYHKNRGMRQKWVRGGTDRSGIGLKKKKSRTIAPTKKKKVKKAPGAEKGGGEKTNKVQQGHT